VTMLGGEKAIAGASGRGSARSNALRLLDKQGADAVRHLHGSLLDHLKRTERRLWCWESTGELALAGLCHAFYGTDGFASVLLGLDQREVLSAAVGSEVEATVYLYASADRGFLYPQIGSMGRPTVRDRFTHVVHTPSEEELRAFVDLTLANEADVAVSGKATTTVPDWFASLVAQFGPAASPPVAEACRQLVASGRSPSPAPPWSNQWRFSGVWPGKTG
jgi:hypothetical protein